MDKTALSAHVRTLARGPGRSRNLTETEAEEAMSLILTGEAPPEAIGALLMLMRFRGETAEEITGFIKATHNSLPAWLRQIKPEIDWPSYAAGRSRGLPYFLLSALLLSENGLKIFMHGYNSHHSTSGSTEEALKILGLSIDETEQQVLASLKQHNFSYMPLRTLSPQSYHLINLRDVLGLRSPVNTVLRSLNPTCAKASIIGVFHPPYISLQTGATLLMNNGDAIVFKGGGGEGERTPLKPVKASYTREGQIHELTFPPLIERADLETDDEVNMADLKEIWRGNKQDAKADATIIATAATALFILNKADTPERAEEMATSFWHQRCKEKFS